jgi:hypothetical protein
MKNIVLEWLTWLSNFLGFTNNKSSYKSSDIINLKIPRDARERLDYLMHKYELRSITELFRVALATFNLLSDHNADGGKIILRYKDGDETELDIIRTGPVDND